jgi:hypothetical protein
MQRLVNPFPLFIDSRGALLDAGFVYVGEANADPETDPINLFLDDDLTQPITQPLRTLGGMIVSGMNAVLVFMEEDDYSIRVTDKAGTLVAYAPSAAAALETGPSFQPLDSDLTAIAALATTAYGRALLTLANQAALQAALGLPAALALVGGTMTGNIVRQGAGTHLYHTDADFTSGRVFVRGPADADPTSLPGDILLRTAT